MTVHTKQLAAGIDVTAGFRFSTVYTVPAGHRTIVKELQVVGIGTGSAVTTVYLSGQFSYSRTHPSGVDLSTQSRWTVLEAGQTIVWSRNVEVGGVNELLVSGTELQL